MDGLRYTQYAQTWKPPADSSPNACLGDYATVCGNPAHPIISAKIRGRFSDFADLSRPGSLSLGGVSFKDIVTCDGNSPMRICEQVAGTLISDEDVADEIAERKLKDILINVANSGGVKFEAKNLADITPQRLEEIDVRFQGVTVGVDGVYLFVR